MLRTILLITLMCCIGAAIAATAPPAQPRSEMSWQARSQEAPTGGIVLGSMVIRFEKIMLSEIVSAVGKGTMGHQGDAGDSEYWLCYSLPQEAQRIWIVSSGEMGGADHFVTGLVAEQLRSADETPDCPALPAKTTAVLSGHKGWLGMTATNVRQRFGTPSYESGSWKAFNFEEKLQSICGKGDRANWLWIKQVDGHVQTIMAGQITSC